MALIRILSRSAQVPADWLTKKLLLSAYEASDDAYWRRQATQCEWRSLGGIVEYSPDLLAVPRDQASPVYLITIRSTANVDLRRVKIKVKAKKSGIIHQQGITQHQLSSTPVRKGLSAIPLKPKSSKTDDWHELGDIYIKLTEAVTDDGTDLVEGKKIADIFKSTGTNSPPGCQVERWGQYWNVDEINAEKENIKTRYYRDLVQSARQLGRPLTVRRAAYRLLTGRLGLSLTFWSQNLWNAECFRASITQAEAGDRPTSTARPRTA